MRALKLMNALLLSLIVGVCLMACNDTDDGSYVAPITLGEKIQGKWVLNSIKQVDEIAGQAMTLTGLFSFTSFSIDFEADAENTPTTFTVEGNAPSLLPTSGSWAMEHSFTNADGTASKIFLYSDVSKSAKTAELTVTSVPGANRVLEFKLTRKAKGQAFVSYVYNLVPVTE